MERADARRAVPDLAIDNLDLRNLVDPRPAHAWRRHGVRPHQACPQAARAQVLGDENMAPRGSTRIDRHAHICPADTREVFRSL